MKIIAKISLLKNGKYNVITEKHGKLGKICENLGKP